MQKIYLLAVCWAGLLFFSCQGDRSLPGTEQHASAMKLDTNTLNRIFEKHRETALFHRRFKHRDVDSLIAKRQTKDVFTVTHIGSSAEGRRIQELVYGDGDISVMLWSQMHGDEPTATMALFDLFNFLENAQGEETSITDLLKTKLKLHFIPMLNPDGAELFIRRNAQSIDLNRDARAGETVEGKILLERGQTVKPHFGFNLHDQNIYYHVPETQNPVTIALLAPAYNEEREINETRGNAMRLIAGMDRLLQQYIPNAVAKYDDAYSPRGFGDKFQSWGTSTVLIESGGLKGDPEKQEIRKLNFIILLNALVEIAQGSFKQYDISGYEAIPFNSSNLLHDVVIKGLQIGTEEIPLRADIAIRRGEITLGREHYVRSWIEDVGDLQESFGYDHVEAEGMRFVEGKTAPTEIKSLATFTKQDAMELLKKGYLAVRLSGPPSEEIELHQFPINIFRQNRFFATPKIDLGGTANFFIADGSGKLTYAVVNGYLIPLDLEAPPSLQNRIL